MKSACGKVICCVNGEIYNHLEIKATCDTEEPPRHTLHEPLRHCGSCTLTHPERVKEALTFVSVRFVADAHRQ